MKPNSCACYGSNDIHECYCNLKNNNMEQETLKEAAERLSDRDGFVDGALFGAKWQAERMYSEEDLREAFKQSRQALIFEKGMPAVYENFEEWFEQFKN